VGGEARGAFEGGHLGDAAAAFGLVGGDGFECGGGLLVEAGGGGGEVAGGADVAVAERFGEGAVGFDAAGARRGVVGGGADQGVDEFDAAAVVSQQVVHFGRFE
ncbi:hypothetical protein ADL26_20735, partial [Thermoactinomyces vulgaris]